MENCEEKLLRFCQCATVLRRAFIDPCSRFLCLPQTVKVLRPDTLDASMIILFPSQTFDRTDERRMDFFRWNL